MSRHRLAALSCVSAVLLTACGGSSDTPDVEESEPAAANTPSEAGADAEEAGADAEGEQFTLRFANALTPQEVPSKAFDAWAEEVASRSDGRITVEVFHSGQLLPPEEMTGAFRDGRAQGGYMFPEFIEAEFPLYTAAGLPFVTMDVEAWMKAWNRMYEDNEAFRTEVNEAGAHLLTHLPTVSGSMAFADPVTSLDGLQGQRIRSFGYWASALETAGATPVFLTTTEALEGLERGVVDGIAPQDMITVVNRGMSESAPHLLQPMMGMFVGTSLVVGKEFWDSLPEDLQQILDETSVDMAERMVQTWMDVGAEACEQLRADGGDIQLLPEAEVEEFEDQVKEPLLEEWRQKAIESGLSEDAVTSFEDEYIAAVDDFEADSEYEDPSVICASQG